MLHSAVDQLSSDDPRDAAAAAKSIEMSLYELGGQFGELGVDLDGSNFNELHATGQWAGMTKTLNAIAQLCSPEGIAAWRGNRVID
jgi:hypothetical protein